MTALRTVYEQQENLREAQWNVSHVYEDIFWALDPKARASVNILEHPDYLAAKATADALAATVASMRDQVGGRVFRVVDSKLDDLADRIAKLNKKAVKLGTDPIILTVSDEHDQVTRKVSAADWQSDIDAAEGTLGGILTEVYDFTYVTVNGPTPMIDGWVFLATLDHEADSGADEGVGIRRAPVGTGLVNRIGQDAADAVEAADLTCYRHADPDCDHCKLDRKRKQTYVLYELSTGALRQIGSTCLRDYTGANNPEKIAAWAEWMEGLYADLEIGNAGGGGVDGGGRIAIPTDLYLANVAAMIRTKGWAPRWTRSYYGDFERNPGATADAAHYNMKAPKATHVAVLDEDWTTANNALTWVRDDLGERDTLDEFQHNLVTYCRADYLPAKGDGFIAAAIGALQREIERKLKAQQTADSDWIGEVKDRIKGLTFAVTFTRAFDGDYGTRWLIKGHDGNGNLLVWWTNSGELKQGTTYTCDATVKAHDTDKYADDAKVTTITNVRGVKEVEVVA